MTAWTLSDIPDLHGKTYVVTGATSGIGLVTARELAERGGYVVLAARDLDKAARVKEQLPDNTEVRRLDVADLDSVREFADGIADWKVDALVNNAGVSTHTKGLTRQGHELMFGTNVLGPFLLTQLMLGHGNITDRIVWTASLAHRAARLDVADLDWDKRTFSGWQAYAASKLGDLVLAYEQQRRFVGQGSVLRSIAAHPGFSATNLFRNMPAPARRAVDLMTRVPYVAQDAAAGAQPLLFAATVPDLPGGSYVGPSGPGEATGAPRPVGSSARSHDRQFAAELWSACEGMAGLA